MEEKIPASGMPEKTGNNTQGEYDGFTAESENIPSLGGEDNISADYAGNFKEESQEYKVRGEMNENETFGYGSAESDGNETAAEEAQDEIAGVPGPEMNEEETESEVRTGPGNFEMKLTDTQKEAENPEISFYDAQTVRKNPEINSYDSRTVKGNSDAQKMYENPEVDSGETSENVTGVKPDENGNRYSAAYAEELTEKFGFSKDVGMEFIDDYDDTEEAYAGTESHAGVGEYVADEGMREDTEQPRRKLTQDLSAAGTEYPEPRGAHSTPVGVQITFLDSVNKNDDYLYDLPEEFRPEDSTDSSEEAGVLAENANAGINGQDKTAGPDLSGSGGEDLGDNSRYTYSVVPEEELTPIEKAAAEEEIRREAEAVSADMEQNAEAVEPEDFNNDIWDEDDRALWTAKKRYMDYCAALTVPHLKITKEKRSSSGRKNAEPESSGYRYEMTERLPLFSDGIAGGKKDESYLKREAEYCRERETKRSAKLLGRLRAARGKCLFSFAVMVAIILMENINIFFKGKPDALLASFPDSRMILLGIETLLLLIGIIPVFGAVRDGIRCALRGVFIPETLTAGTVFFAVVYHVFLMLVPTLSEYSVLFGTSAAIAMFLASLYRYGMLKREYTAFSVSSSYGSYLTEVKMLGFSSSPEGKAFEGYAAPDTSLYRLNRVRRIDGAYSDKPVRDECFGVIRKLALGVLCVSVVCGVVFGLIRRDMFYGVLSALCVFSFSSPVSFFVAAVMPRLKAASVSAAAGGAIMDFDDESDDFDDSVIMIDDGELFPPDKMVSHGFEMQRSPDIEKHLSRTRALFNRIGGTFSAVFKNMESGLQGFEEISFTEISENGISAVIDGSPIHVGSESYLMKYGVKVKRYDRLLPRNGRVVYVADDGVFFARAVFIFNPDEELVSKISELSSSGTLFSLKTCNPCIDRDLLFFSTGLSPDIIRLIKYKEADDPAPAETDREGCLVSKNGALGLLTAMLEYKRQKKRIFTSAAFAGFACVAGAFVSLLLCAAGVASGFSSVLALALHGILSVAAFVLYGRGQINAKGKIKKK